MSFRNFKTNSYCVGQKHYSGPKNIVGELTFKKETGREIKTLVGQRSVCNRKKSLIVSDNTIQVERLGDFFKHLGKKRLNVSKNMAKKVIKNMGRALEIGANVSTAFASRSPKATSSTLPKVINIYHGGHGLFFGKFN